MEEKKYTDISLGEKLRCLRESHDMSQADLAKKMNLTRQTISGWERDRSQPDILSVQKLASIYGITVDELLCGVEKEAKKPSRWRWVFFAMACGLFLYAIADGSHFYTFQGVEIGIIGGADGPVAIFASASFWGYLISVLPLLNLLVAFFCVYLVLQWKNDRVWKSNLLIAIGLTLLSAIYLIFHAVILFVQWDWSDFFFCFFNPGFWVPLIVASYSFKIGYGKKHQIVF